MGKESRNKKEKVYEKSGNGYTVDRRAVRVQLIGLRRPSPRLDPRGGSGARPGAHGIDAWVDRRASATRGSNGTGTGRGY